jgi:WD40 repeat protein
MSAVVAPASPYKGLAAFGDSDLDAFFFFGRERERSVIVANLIAARLTVLYGPTGVGKSSVLRAGVVHRLRELARTNLVRTGSPELAVVVVDAWADDPRKTVLDAVAAELETYDAGPLTETLAAWTQARDITLYLILDQFEEYFLYHDAAESGPLGHDLPELLSRDDLRVNLLLSLREDTLAQLDAFKGRIPNLFANSLRLERLDPRSARAAIVGPIERYNELVEPNQRVSIEPALADALLDEVAAGKVDLGSAGIGELPEHQKDSRIEAPYLQLVLERLWEEERERPSSVLRLSTLHELGGSEAIVRAHLERALGSLSPTQRDLAANVFNHLVTPSGTKIAHRASDLAEYAAVGKEDLVPVLGALGRERIVRAVDGSDGGTERYEIFHDVLADAVLAWRARLQLDHQHRAAEKRHRRLMKVTAAALVALALMAAITIYALAERSHARAQARRARAGQLAANAVSELDADPQHSLALAVGAAGGESSPRIEAVLRQALLAARLRRVLRVGSDVRFVAYSHNGAHVLTGGADGVVRIWTARTGQAAITLRQGAPLIAAEYDARGSRILTAGGGTARLWEAATGRQLATLRHDGIASAVFSSDGTKVVTGGADHRARVWQAADGKLLRTVQLPGPVQLVAMSPSGRRIVAVANLKGHVQARLINAQTDRIMRTLPQRGITDAEFSPDGRLLATASADGTTSLWRASDGRLVRVLDDGGGSITDLTFAPYGSLLATTSRDGAVRVWLVAKGERLFFFTTHAAPTTHVAFDPTGSFLVSTSEDRTGRIWEITGIEEGRPVALLAGHAESVDVAAFSPDGNSLVTGSQDGTARLWDGRIEQHLRVVDKETSPVDHAAFANGGRLLVAVVGRQVKALAHGAPVRSFPAGGNISAITRDGLYRATVAAANSIEIQSVPTGHTIARLRAEAAVTALAFRPDGREIVTADKNGGVAIWDTAKEHRLRRFHAGGPILRVALAPQADLVLTTGADGSARIWSSAGKLRHTLHGHPAPITDARFDPTGTRIVTASQGSNRNVIVWDARTGHRLRVLIGHYGTVTAASFSPDGRWILTAGPISAAIWTADTGRLLFYLRGPTDLLTDAEWSPTGYRVVTAARDGTVRTYDCEVCRPLDDLVSLARDRLAATANPR